MAFLLTGYTTYKLGDILGFWSGIKGTNAADPRDVKRNAEHMVEELTSAINQKRPANMQPVDAIYPTVQVTNKEEPAWWNVPGKISQWYKAEWDWVGERANDIQKPLTQAADTVKYVAIAAIAIGGIYVMSMLKNALR